MLIISNVLLSLMLICYVNPLYIIYKNYNNNYTISEIITNTNVKINIFFWACLLSIFTLLYEYYRNNNSLIIIIFLLIGIIGVIFTEEKICLFCYHTFFASIVFLSITIFMIYHVYKKLDNILFLLFFIFFLFLFKILYLFNNFKNQKSNIFFYECSLIIIFAIFYMYLHFI